LVEMGFPRRVIVGERLEDALPQLLDAVRAKRVLVVSDGIVSALPFFDRVKSSLSGGGYELCVFTDVEPEPSMEIAERVAEAIASCGADAVVAVGGGSVIDAAKAGLVKHARPDMSLEDVAPFNPIGLELSRPVLIAVPTTSGTGSDASYGIVLTKVEYGKRLKIAVGSYEVVPYATVLDPSITVGMSRRLTVGTAVDALAHSIEALASNQANDLTDALSLKAMGIIVSNLPKVLEDPSDLEAREALHLAATMAGMAFTNAGLGLAHAIAHPLGAALRIHHGTMVGLVLPYVVEYNSHEESARLKYEQACNLLDRLLGYGCADDLASTLRRFYDDIGQPYRLRDLGVGRDEFEAVKEAVSEEALHDPEVAYNPRIPTVEDVAELLERMY